MVKAMAKRTFFSHARTHVNPTAPTSPQSVEAPPPKETEMSEQPEVPELPIKDAEVINEADLIAESFAEVQKEMDAAAAPPQVDPTMAAMLRIAQSMETMVKRQDEVRQIPLTEIKPVSPWNPEGKMVRLSAKRPMYQHGIPLNPLTLTERTIDLFNQIKPGRYFGRKIEVQRFQDGGVNLQWSGKQLDQRIEFYSQFKHIDEILQAIIIEREQKEARRKAGEFDADEEL